MKIFIQDCGWRGSIVVVADNEEQAREMMKDEYNYEPTGSIEAKEIKPGLIWVDLGDCWKVMPIKKELRLLFFFKF